MNVKRFTALASTTLVTAGLVATALAQGKTDLSVLWMTGGTGDQPLLERYAKLYETANPNVSVQLTFVPLPQLAQKLQLMVAGKTPPDVSRITTSTIADFAPLAADLKGTINPKDFMASQLPYVQSGKRLIGAPLDITATALYYNKDCFAEAGIKVPSKPELAWTWEQWRGVMETVTKKSKCRYALSWEPTTHRWGAALYQAGGRYISNDGKKFVVDSPEGLRAFTFFHDLFKDNLIPKGIWLSGEDATGYFKSQHVHGDQQPHPTARANPELQMGRAADAQRQVPQHQPRRNLRDGFQRQQEPRRGREVHQVDHQPRSQRRAQQGRTGHVRPQGQPRHQVRRVR
jgi:alpha-1,4-digalacturonate transport system substrate-binding protein